MISKYHVAIGGADLRSVNGVFLVLLGPAWQRSEHRRHSGLELHPTCPDQNNTPDAISRFCARRDSGAIAANERFSLI